MFAFSTEKAVVRESKTESTAQAVANELAKAPSCRRIVFETGRMTPIPFHGLSQLRLPVVCVESRQAYQALKSLATHKTDRNDARGLAHLARTGFFKPVHVKSLPAHAIRSLISARKKLVGQRVTLENQIRGLAVVFGVRLPRALSFPAKPCSSTPNGCTRPAGPSEIGADRRTIAKWVSLDDLPDRQRSAIKPSSPLYFQEFLERRWAAGDRSGRRLFHDVRNRGYIGSFSHLERLLSTWRKGPPGQTPLPSPPAKVEPLGEAPAIDPTTG
jgi:hypothetical protein